MAGEPVGDLVATGLVTGVLSTVFTLVVANLTFRFAKRPEIEATVRQQLDAALRLRAEDRAQQVQRQIAACSGPLLIAAEELAARLDNILRAHGFVALAHDWDAKRPASWSNTHEYFLTSTLYLFGRYFAWAQVLRDQLGPDEYLLQRDKDDLRSRLRGVADALAVYPAPYNLSGAGEDRQVMTWEQVAMGEVLIFREENVPHVLGYPAFRERQSEMDFHFQPLRALIVDLSPTPADNCRWQRVLSVRAELAQVTAECRRLLAGGARSEDQGSGGPGSGARTLVGLRRARWRGERAVPVLDPPQTAR